MKNTGLALLCALILAFSTAFAAGGSNEKLLLVGGGDTPAHGDERFCEWAGGKKARILIVTWATEYPVETFHDMVEEFAFCHPAAIDAAPSGPFSPEQKKTFMAQLKTYSAIFFTGGDQVRILDILADPDLLQEMRDLYHSGIPFGGTSAGTAIMSHLTITGNGDFTVLDGDAVETRPGLGLQDGIIVDTHFLKRQRENRLLGLILKHPHLLGVGINEGMAILVTGGRYAEVTGPTQVMLADAAAGNGGVKLKILRDGERVDLRALR